MTFEAKLRAFFKKHDPGREYLAPRMAKQFMKNKDVVLVHLAKRYSRGGVQFKGYSTPAPQLAAPAEEVHEISDAVHEEMTEFAADAEAMVSDAEANVEDIAGDVSDAAEDLIKGDEE